MLGDDSSVSLNRRPDPWLLAPAAVPDGRECKLCPAADDAPDPVHPSRFHRWGYSPTADPPANIGMICFRCIKTYKARFMIRYKSIKGLIAKIHEDDAVCEEFNALQKFCTETCVKVLSSPS